MVQTRRRDLRGLRPLCRRLPPEDPQRTGPGSEQPTRDGNGRSGRHRSMSREYVAGSGRPQCLNDAFVVVRGEAPRAFQGRKRGMAFVQMTNVNLGIQRFEPSILQSRAPSPESGGALALRRIVAM